MRNAKVDVTAESVGKQSENGEATENEEKSEKVNPNGERGDMKIGEKSIEESAQEIIKNYLLEILKSKPSVTLTGGAVVTAPPHKPKTLAEASSLATEYIKLKGETI
ncbi:MAG: hypothetical protein MJ072_04900 [Clostridia bacterium]|nr:hypothetical protein [Clostridia bacterium]